MCTCCGCFGAVRQTLRRGCLSGRKILCIHQLLLSTVLVFSVTQHEWLNKREHSLRLVLEDHASFPEYDGFERRVSKYFNNGYFDSLCSNDPSTKWLLNWIDKSCPERMTQDYCALSDTQKETCNTSCPAIRNINEATPFDLMMCCPSEELCKDDKKDSCPYHRCRVEILEELTSCQKGRAGNSQSNSNCRRLLQLIYGCLQLSCWNSR